MNNSNILILEDDPDQLLLLVDFVQNEVKKILGDENTNKQQQKVLKEIGIIKVSNVKSLQKAASIHKNVLLAILDCNTPDKKGGESNDQLIKTNHIVTGQHKPVDIVTHYLPNTPITLISSLNRFQRTISRYYESKQNLKINFISKDKPVRIQDNIKHHLMLHLSSQD